MRNLVFLYHRALCILFGHRKTEWPEEGWIKCPRCGLIPGLKRVQRWYQPPTRPPRV